MNLPQREDYACSMMLQVRWGDADMIGHVNNARFFTYAESARIAYFEDLLGGDPRFWKEHGFILARIDCDFLAQVHYPADIEVCTRVTRIGRTSMQIEHGMFVADKPVARSQAVLVWFDYVGQCPTEVPDQARAFIRARERVAPQES